MEPRAGTTGALGEGRRFVVVDTGDDGVGRGESSVGSDVGVGGGVGGFRSDARTGSTSADVGGGGGGAGAGTGAGAGGTEELEDWLDGMLADS